MPTIDEITELEEKLKKAKAEADKAKEDDKKPEDKPKEKPKDDDSKEKPAESKIIKKLIDLLKPVKDKDKAKEDDKKPEKTEKPEDDGSKEALKAQAEQLEDLQNKMSEIQFGQIIDKACAEYKIESEDAKEYFNFLLVKKTEETKGELASKDLAELAKKTLAIYPTKGRATSVDEPKDKKVADPAHAKITVKEFQSMNLMEKSDLYKKSPDIFKRLDDEQTRAEGFYVIDSI